MKKYLLLIPAALGRIRFDSYEFERSRLQIQRGCSTWIYQPGYYNGGYCYPGYGVYHYRRVYYRPARYPGYYYGNGYTVAHRHQRIVSCVSGSGASLLK